jgi:hypothetical protein
MAVEGGISRVERIATLLDLSDVTACLDTLIDTAVTNDSRYVRPGGSCEIS